MRSRSGAHRAQRKVGAQPRLKRVRALLAGGLVLGVGTAVTLASWTDQEVASGDFRASTFGIVGSTDGTSFAEHPTTPAALAFSMSPNALSPGSTVYARFVVRTTNTTDVAGTVQLGGASVTGTGLGTHLRYGVRTIPATSACNATTYGAGTLVVAANSPLTAGAASGQSLAVAGASPVGYCFAVTLPAGTPNDAQGKVATATWTFTATSNS
ncbi:SipW-dependent-type signal peptide-containing protein [Leucobacter sp. GX24907]